MVLFSSFKSKVSSIPRNISNFVRGSPVLTGATLGGSVLVGGQVVRMFKKRRATKKKKKRTTRRTRTRTRRKTKKVKRRKRSVTSRAGSKRIRKTKNGQPYIILKSGKARFIKRSTARRAKKRKGGLY